MTRIALSISDESLKTLAQIQSQFMGTSFTAQIKAILRQERLNALMNAEKPLTILTEDGHLIRNHAAKLDEVRAEQLKAWLIHNDIVEKLQSQLTDKSSDVDAYRRVISDLQSSLTTVNSELGKADQITRNRRTFSKLLQETFSIRIGFVSVNVQKFILLLRFIYGRPVQKS